MSLSPDAAGRAIVQGKGMGVNAVLKKLRGVGVLAGAPVWRGTPGCGARRPGYRAMGVPGGAYRWADQAGSRKVSVGPAGRSAPL